jgi:predicted TIM-barrel fold metal-dependent hydrolase
MKVDGIEVIDCHIHPFMEAESNTSWFPGTETPEIFVEQMKKAGINRCCGSVIRSLENPSFEQIKQLNREALAFRDRFPGFYIPGINVHGNYPDESCAEIEALYEQEDIRWIGELVAYMMDYQSYASEAMFKIYELIQAMDLTVNIHPYGLEEIEKVCRNFPRLKLVVAHPTSGKNEILARFELIKKYPNTYLDLSGSGVFRWGILRHGIDVAGKEKFLFGSDFPICSPGMMLQGILAEKLSDDELEAVLSGNFKNLVGI